VITSGGGSGLSEWRIDLGSRESGKAADGLVSAPLDGRGPLQILSLRSCRRVTAIGARPDGEGFVTGGLDGELDAWSWTERWEHDRVRARPRSEP
jgi:hypothetical protein